MAVEKLEIETYFGKCKCCLNYGYLRTMWEKHIVEERTEIYGQMLTQCFSIEWTIQNSEEDDQICEDCIWKLREAFTFKKQVLQCQKELKSIQVDEELEIKSEPDDESYAVEYLDEEYLEEYNNNENSDKESEERLSEEERHSPVDEDSNGSKDDDDDIDENQNPNEDDEDITPAPRKRKPRQANIDIEDSDTDTPKPKWPKKLPKQERWKTYKQYSEEAMIEAVKAVISKSMNQKDASKRFKVPRKTLSARILSVKNNVPEFRPQPRMNLVHELKTLLSFVNATPFRSWTNYYCCFYCTERTTFSDVEALKHHTRTKHKNYAVLLKAAMSPLTSNEIVRLDLTQAQCTVCSLALTDWAHTIRHLRSTHSIIFQDSHKMIPFVLKADKCALCDRKFSAFMKLDTHMNSHYNNYVCDHCGVPFASASRLHAHEKTHSTGRFRCSISPCNRVFSLAKYLKKHIAFMHNKELEFKCRYCSEIFKGEYKRHAHMVEHHKEYLKHVSCDLCGSEFSWMKHLLRHIKRKHNAQHVCQQCGKYFETGTSLKEHQEKHTDDFGL